MTNWFLVTSAMNVDYGIFSLQEKYEQTCITIDSIRKYCPEAKIILLESSPQKLPDYRMDHLREITDMYIDFSGDDIIQSMHKTLLVGAIKSLSEAYIVGSFLSMQNLVKEKDRVFKISGRYFLTDDFDLRFHENQKEKIVFLTKKPYTQYHGVESGKDIETISPFQYSTRLYSFCGSLTKYFANKCFNIFTFFQEKYGVDFYSDLEHAMYRFTNHDLVVEINPIGVSGYAADRIFKAKE